MTDQISVTGLVATDPRSGETTNQDPYVSFRMASQSRRFNKEESRWESGATNWYTVQCFRQLAVHVSQSVAKGDRVLVRGRLKVRDWDNGERSGTSVEIDADSIGHDLMFGVTSYERTTHVEDHDEEESEAELQPA